MAYRIFSTLSEQPSQAPPEAGSLSERELDKLLEQEDYDVEIDKGLGSIGHVYGSLKAIFVLVIGAGLFLFTAACMMAQGAWKDSPLVLGLGLLMGGLAIWRGRQFFKSRPRQSSSSS